MPARGCSTTTSMTVGLTNRARSCHALSNQMPARLQHYYKYDSRVDRSSSVMPSTQHTKCLPEAAALLQVTNTRAYVVSLAPTAQAAWPSFACIPLSHQEMAILWGSQRPAGALATLPISIVTMQTLHCPLCPPLVTQTAAAAATC